jgi:hypothetical protein
MAARWAAWGRCSPTGDVEADMARIKAFYAPIQGKNADQFDVE